VADRRPLVQIAGRAKELPTTDKLPISAISTGTPDGTKFVRDDGVLAVPAGGGGSTSDTRDFWLMG
jgi:hypothetical protein